MDSRAEVAMRSLDSSRVSRELVGGWGGAGCSSWGVGGMLMLSTRPQSQSMETSRALARAESDSALGIVLALRYSDMETCLMPDNSDKSFWVNDLLFMVVFNLEEKFVKTIFFSCIKYGEAILFLRNRKSGDAERRLR